MRSKISIPVPIPMFHPSIEIPILSLFGYLVSFIVFMVGFIYKFATMQIDQATFNLILILVILIFSFSLGINIQFFLKNIKTEIERNEEIAENQSMQEEYDKWGKKLVDKYEDLIKENETGNDEAEI